MKWLLCFLPLIAFSAPKPLFQSKLITSSTPGLGIEIDVDLQGAEELYLVVTDGGNGFACDWADWAEPRLVMADGTEKKLTEVEWKSAQSRWGGVRVNANAGGQELRSGGKSIAYGLGTHANSLISYHLPKGTRRFRARGVLDEGGTNQQGGTASSVDFRVYTANPGPVVASDVNTANNEPENALEQLDVHPECVAQLFASEPMMLSPASIDVDHRGRVWVCEVVNYRKHNGERPEGDRILIIEDTNGDAKADKSTVFYQGRDVDSAHGICVLGNKALISCGDDVFWLIDDNNDDKADRKELMFTKIGGAQHDHGIHAFHFGPDGRLYFNFGNSGKQLCDKNGNLITDIHGVKCTNQNNRPYQQGMVFRCELDGSNVEVLAWNFRNNWEVAVDSFGTMWQSDNDDDGNKAVRINYVMEYGNFGYSDEMTGEGWQVPRIGMEKDIPERHWHQNDPGVVPNVLITGSGSPTGMQVYEGSLLPKIFHGQPIHCDAGPNVVRAYITKPDGAGYKAEIVNILDGSKNRWFRPSDVAVAPDGSLIVADWYDPGVGGHGMGDVTRGRLFRVTVPGREKYAVPSAEFGTVDGAVEALKSPNEDMRYLGWSAIRGFKDKSEPGLKALLENKDAAPNHRARALWLGSKQNAACINAALREDQLVMPLRTTAIRAAQQLWQKADPARLRQVIAHAMDQFEAPWESVLALRFDGSEEASKLWSKFSNFLPNRFGIEALLIGAAVHPESRFEALVRKPVLASPDHIGVHLNLTSNMRASRTAPAIADWLTHPTPVARTDEVSVQKRLPMLRALQILQYNHGKAVAEVAKTIFLKADNDTALAAVALLSRDVIKNDPAAQERLDTLLKPVIGKPEFVGLVERLSLTGFEKELLEYILANPNAPESITAAKILAANRDDTATLLEKSDPENAMALVNVLGRVGDRASVAVLNTAFWKLNDNSVRNATIAALAMTSEGARVIMRWHGEKKLPEAQITTAALALSRSTDAGVRGEAAKAIPLPAAQGLQKFPVIPELMKLTGDVGKGQAMFAQAGCVACHRVKGQFIDFGPDLTQIGGKLSKDGLFSAILYPSAAIEHSFIGLAVTTKEGQTLVGYAVSETDAEMTLRTAGGAATTIKKASITKRDIMKDSLMPPGLAAAIGPQGLADLVAWMATLR
ncbi:MAG: NPCBM/NEW2 domain-containing protein [Verrucomicrobiaceae bacterium]|nr:NPCBM/NEW2 domain-containing protein [Verrucomicrobiaceae bacterium]